jgi:hypothetical protein
LTKSAAETGEGFSDTLRVLSLWFDEDTTLIGTAVALFVPAEALIVSAEALIVSADDIRLLLMVLSGHSS